MFEALEPLHRLHFNEWVILKMKTTERLVIEEQKGWRQRWQVCVWRCCLSSTVGLTFFTVGYFCDQHLPGVPAYLHKGGHFHRSSRGDSESVHHRNDDNLFKVFLSLILLSRGLTCRNSFGPWIEISNAVWWSFQGFQQIVDDGEIYLGWENGSTDI